MNEVRKAYKRLFDSEDGRTVFKDLCARGFVTRPCSSTDPHEEAQQAGMQRLVLSIGRFAYGRQAEEMITETVENQDYDSEVDLTRM